MLEIFIVSENARARLILLEPMSGVTQRVTMNNKKNSFAMVNGSWHGSVDQFMFDYKQNKHLNLNSLPTNINY